MVCPWYIGLAALSATLPVRASLLVIERVIPLPAVHGRIDHLDLDRAGERLFVAALGNDSVEVIDLRQGRVIQSLAGLAEPQGVVFVPEFNLLYIANGGDGTVRKYDGKTYNRVKTIAVGDDADNLRYDPAAKWVYVGYGDGALAIIDAATGNLVGSLALEAHPESFQLERDSARIFVNLPGAHTIATVDRKGSKVTGKWSPGSAAANFPMALDEAQHHLFVACRAPACLLVFDTETGKELARLNLHGDCDDLFYDSLSKQLFAACGEGYIDVFDSSAAQPAVFRESVQTMQKARTCFLDGQRLFLAVPMTGKRDAEVIEYRISP